MPLRKPFHASAKLIERMPAFRKLDGEIAVQGFADAGRKSIRRRKVLNLTRLEACLALRAIVANALFPRRLWSGLLAMGHFDGGLWLSKVPLGRRRPAQQPILAA
jgi:hypothetical protein